jgi:hypothetical protein
MVLVVPPVPGNAASTASGILLPLGLVHAEVKEAAAVHQGTELRRLLGQGVALALTRNGDNAGFEEAEALLRHIADVADVGDGWPGPEQGPR